MFTANSHPTSARHAIILGVRRVPLIDFMAGFGTKDRETESSILTTDWHETGNSGSVARTKSALRRLRSRS